MANDTAFRDALAKLLRQLEMGEFINKDGHKITTNIAFLNAKKLFEPPHPPS